MFRRIVILGAALASISTVLEATNAGRTPSARITGEPRALVEPVSAFR